MSKTYEEFAGLYDGLMEDAPYDQWVQLVSTCLKDRDEPPTILELGSGTGTLALSLIKKGFSVTVSDYSSDMLTIAEEKCRQEGLEGLSFYQLDMQDFSLNETFDAVVIFCDAMNYLPDEHAVERTFHHVHDHLKSGGSFLFDVHSTFKMDFFLSQQTFGSSEEAVSYLWECFPGDAPFSVIHDLTFFIQQKGNLYKRVEETHEQRTYPLDTYLTLLEKAGFKEVKVLGDFGEEPNLPEAHRWVFHVKKP